ncbi:MAG: hypothetical protein LAP40_20250 [Acidobacteriia bacterium]|nr:hypothetical protein [Terriglobia bacterium]
MVDVVGVFARWLHIASVVTLIGGMLYASMVMAGAAGALTKEAADTLMERAAARFRPLVWTAVIALTLSGSYNLITTPGHSSLYRMLIAVKLLLVLHVFAAALLAAKPKNPRRVRQMTGAFVSGLVIILISDYLRHIF